MRVILIEDNLYHSERVKKCLEDTFEDVAISILRTEHDVFINIDNIAEGWTDIIILDVILPWCKIDYDMPELPIDYDDGGPYRAGIRCLKAFINHTKIKKIPIIVHSVVDPEILKEFPNGLPSNVIFLRKPLLPETMAEIIESFVMLHQPSRKNKTFKDTLLEASELKVGLKDLKIDIKKIINRKKS